jgi:hypothetical protein
MLASALLSALAATLPAPVPPPAPVRAQTQVFVQIIQAAEVRGGSSNSPHQRTVRRGETGQAEILLQFE